jgi:hypothetical protein
MVDDQHRNEGQPSDRDSRKRFSRVRWLVLVGIVIVLGFRLLKDMQRDGSLITWDEARGQIEMPIAPDSPGVQLVGSEKYIRHYGMFRFGAPSTCESHATVIYENHRYFLVAAAPDGFFRSLIDKNKFPHIASEPLDKRPMTATSAAEAMDEARLFLRGCASAWN